MSGHLENLQNFGELEDYEKVRYLVRGSGVLIVLLGILLFFTLDGVFVPGLIILVGLLDITVISTFVANQQKKSTEDV